MKTYEVLQSHMDGSKMHYADSTRVLPFDNATKSLLARGIIRERAESEPIESTDPAPELQARRELADLLGKDVIAPEPPPPPNGPTRNTLGRRGTGK